MLRPTLHLLKSVGAAADKLRIEVGACEPVLPHTAHALGHHLLRPTSRFLAPPLKPPRNDFAAQRAASGHDLNFLPRDTNIILIDNQIFLVELDPDPLQQIVVNALFGKVQGRWGLKPRIDLPFAALDLCHGFLHVPLAGPMGQCSPGLLRICVRTLRQHLIDQFRFDGSVAFGWLADFSILSWPITADSLRRLELLATLLATLRQVLIFLSEIND